MNKKHFPALLACIGLFLLLKVPVAWSAAAAEEVQVEKIRALGEQVTLIETELKNRAYDQKELAKVTKSLIDYKTRASDCTARAQDALKKIDADLKQLGEQKDKESAEVAQQLKTHKEKRAAAEARLAECTALDLHIESVHDALRNELKRQLEAQMLSRGPDILELAGRNFKQPVSWVAQALQYIRDKGWLFNAATRPQIIGLIATLLIAILLGWFLRRRGLPWAASRSWPDSYGGYFACSFMATTFYYAPQVFGTLALSVYMWVLTRGVEPAPMFSTLAYALSFLVVTSLVIRIILSPVAPGRTLVNVAPPVAEKLARRLQVLAVLIFFGYLLIGTLFGASLPDYANSLARRVLRLLVAINIIWVLWLFRHLTGLLHRAWFRHTLTAVVVFAVLADLSGYYYLGGWLLRSVFGTLIAYGLVSTLLRLSNEFFGGLETARAPWQQWTRRLLGLPATERLPGFFWLRVLVNAGLWVFLIWLLILVWDLSSSAVQEMRGFMGEGFQIGFLHIVPIRVIFALLALVALIAFTAWVKGVMKARLEHSPMERGAREAVVTITGYVGVVIAILASLSVAGIEFSNIALVAGALSVGIGFGLQNIVNNFVSGLILLFERPIKTGDWIVVGQAEGHVRRIRIRSTQIRTFDRADVIVPNSELISGQVTNWMLTDRTGRARIPVGVAYGTDTEKVKEVLLKIAADHPEVLSDGRVPEPFVLFLRFGDSSLDFELRCHIRNIDQRLRVVSDINFAIDKAFREAGIVIPFPQRDLHIYTEKPAEGNPAPDPD